MDDRQTHSVNRATAAVASVFGVLSGLGGFQHGVGEILQGNVAPGGVVINSWVQGPIATNLGGEPGMTLIPNLLITGVATIVVSSALILWSALFVRRKIGAPVQLVLSVAMLLVGGGFAPPVIGVLASLAAFGIHAPYRWWRLHLAGSFAKFLAGAWPWLFGVSVLNGVFLVVGSVLLTVIVGLNTPDLFVGSFFFAFVSVLLCIWTGPELHTTSAKLIGKSSGGCNYYEQESSNKNHRRSFRHPHRDGGDRPRSIRSAPGQCSTGQCNDRSHRSSPEVLAVRH